MITNKYYPGEPVNIHIQSLTNIIQDNNWVITRKKDKGKLPLFCGNGKWVIPIYACRKLNLRGQAIWLHTPSDASLCMSYGILE